MCSLTTDLPPKTNVLYTVSLNGNGLSSTTSHSAEPREKRGPCYRAGLLAGGEGLLADGGGLLAGGRMGRVWADLGRVRCLLGRRTFYAEHYILRSMRHKDRTNQKTGRPFYAPLAHVAPVSCEWFGRMVNRFGTCLLYCGYLMSPHSGGGGMGRADIERVIRQLSGQLARPQLVNTLVEVRKRVISTRPGLEEFVRLGGLTPLTELLKQPQPADVFNVALSVLGNCTARPAGRQHFVQHGGLHAVLNVLQLVADPEVANRACRTLANLAQEPALCRTLHQEDTLELVEGLLAADQQPPPPDELRTTVFRLMRSEDV